MIQRYNNNILVQNSELFIVHESAIYHDEVNVLAVAVETLPDQSMLVTIAGCQKEQIWGQKSQSYGYGYWYKAITSVIAWYSRASQQPKKNLKLEKLQRCKKCLSHRCYTRHLVVLKL
jgi:hypothetical protein